DNSSNGPAFAAITILNEGLIQGDGHGPTSVTPADAAAFDPAGREGINIVGTFDDSVTNKGTIIGAVRMGGGNDTVDLYTGSSVSGMLDGGAGTDTLSLHGTGVGTVGSLDGFERINFLDDGEWTVHLSSNDLGATIDGFSLGDVLDIEGLGV